MPDDYIRVMVAIGIRALTVIVILAVMRMVTRGDSE